MKKIIIITITCLLLIATPALAGFQAKTNLFTKLNNYEADEAPKWADGTFNGTWGLREYNWLVDLLDGNKTGMVEIELGNVTGHYGKYLKQICIFQGEFYPYCNTSQKSNISGVSLGRILGGRIGDIDVDAEDYNFELEEANYCGIGGINQTGFDWRIMLSHGPTFYIKGTYNSF